MRILTRILVAACGAVGLVAAALNAAAHRSARAELAAQVGPGLASERGTVALARLARESDPGRARAQAARSLLAEVLTDPPAGGEESLDAARGNLALARELAGRAAADRPASAPAAMTFGAATYLDWSFARDGRLFTKAASWEDPLKRARELEPSNPEPSRFLSMAYLEVWRALSPAKRRDATELLREGFRDPGTFDRLIGAWLATAPDLETALEVLPVQPYPWERLRSRFAHAADWESYARATLGWHQALDAEFEHRFAAAEALKADGYVRAARASLLTLVQKVPVDRRFAPSLTLLLERLPPGPVDRESEERLVRWLDWCLELHLLTGCPLPQAAVGRLAGLTGRREPAIEALAALAAGDLVKAEELERRGDLMGVRWGPYHLAKVGPLLERGETDGARRALGRVHPAWHMRPAYWRQRRGLAEETGDAAAVREADARLAEMARSRWRATAWSLGERQARLELFARRAGRLSIALAELPEGQPGVVVRLDGGEVGIYPARNGGIIHLPAEVAAGSHLLEVATLGPGTVVPGEVILARPAG